MKQWIGLALAAAALGACGSQPEAGGVTAEESRKLNEAAEMLDAPSDAGETGDLPVTSEAATNAE